MSDDERTLKAIRGCADWLAACLHFGWRREDLDALEALWWKYHNHRGELISDVERAAARGKQDVS